VALDPEWTRRRYVRGLRDRRVVGRRKEVSVGLCNG
jgi:hypothetical protein